MTLLPCCPLATEGKWHSLMHGDSAGRGRLTLPTLNNSSLSRKGECHVALSQKGHVAPTGDVRKLLSTVGAPGKPQRF